MTIIGAPQCGHRKMARRGPAEGGAVAVGDGSGATGRRRLVEQCARGGKVALAIDIGHESVMADAMKTPRQHVEQETPHEFTSIQRHGLVTRPSLGPVILPAEGDMVLIHGDQARVGDATRWV